MDVLFYSSGYGGSGKFNDSHSYAASVTCAICGPKYKRNVCKPVPNPTDDKIPENKNKRCVNSTVFYNIHL